MFVHLRFSSYQMEIYWGSTSFNLLGTQYSFALSKLVEKKMLNLFTSHLASQKKTVLFICKTVFDYFNGNSRQTKLKCIITQDLS